MFLTDGEAVFGQFQNSCFRVLQELLVNIWKTAGQQTRLAFVVMQKEVFSQLKISITVVLLFDLRGICFRLRSAKCHNSTVDTFPQANELLSMQRDLKPRDVDIEASPTPS
jgi:hypothetical protein